MRPFPVVVAATEAQLHQLLGVLHPQLRELSISRARSAYEPAPAQATEMNSSDHASELTTTTATTERLRWANRRPSGGADLQP